MRLQDIIIDDLKTKLQEKRLLIDHYGENIMSTLYQRIEAMIEAMFSEGEDIFLEDKVLVKDVATIENFDDFRRVYELWFVEELLFDLDEEVQE